MKTGLYTSVLLLTGILLAGPGLSNIANDNMKMIPGKVLNKTIDDGSEFISKTALVNTHDTVIFDMSQAVITGSYIEIPVSVFSDDTIYAFDFSMQYDHANLAFDSVIDHTNYLQAFSFYNTMDSTLRFTSSSLQAYTHDTALVSIRFNMLSGQPGISDLHAIHAYLNGDSCSYKAIDFLATGISPVVNNEEVKVYPNPSAGILMVETGEKSVVQLMDLNGRDIINALVTNKDQVQEISLRGISNGIYMVRIIADDFTFVKRIVISR